MTTGGTSHETMKDTPVLPVVGRGARSPSVTGAHNAADDRLYMRIGRPSCKSAARTTPAVR